jgi:predicted O-methyltransferase YrrM
MDTKQYPIVLPKLVKQAQRLAAEFDFTLASAAAQLFVNVDNVQVLNEDWKKSFKQNGPFDLLFSDGGGVGSSDQTLWQSVVDLLAPGGILVIDDLTPEELWPDDWQGQPDSKRELAFVSNLFTSSEIRIRHDVSALLMVKK